MLLFFEEEDFVPLREGVCLCCLDVGTGVSTPCSRQKDPPMSISVSWRESLFVVVVLVLEAVRDAVGLPFRDETVPVVFERLNDFGLLETAVGVLAAAGDMVASSPMVAWRISSKKVQSPSLISLAICLPVRMITSLGCPSSAERVSSCALIGGLVVASVCCALSSGFLRSAG